MLENIDAIPNVAVKDVKKARKFYEGTLGLKVVGTESDEVVVFQSGGNKLYVYRSAYAGTNKATNVSWPVGDKIGKVVADLGRKGVAFEHYKDMPGAVLDGDIHVFGDMRVAWFKDPDGNILSVLNG